MRMGLAALESWLGVEEPVRGRAADMPPAIPQPLPAAAHNFFSIQLQVLDELGRGTATHDGHAIAHGVALHLAQAKRCRCAFGIQSRHTIGSRSAGAGVSWMLSSR